MKKAGQSTVITVREQTHSNACPMVLAVLKIGGQWVVVVMVDVGVAVG